jgi:hypothetical protein
MAWRGELCRRARDRFALGSVLVFTTDTLVVTGLFLPGAWPASPQRNSVRLLCNASRDVVAARGSSSTFASG